MAGKRQPTALVEANGKKHLTYAEADNRRDREVYVPPPEQVQPPKWLPKKLCGEYLEIAGILLAAGLYAELDRDVLGQYFLARERWLRADKRAAAAIRDARQLRRILAEGGDPRQVLSLRHVEDADLAQAEEDLLRRDMPNWLPILYGLTAMFGDDPEDLAAIDIWDERLWYLCNPSLGRHLRLRNIRNEAREAKLTEAAERLFRWLRLNQWISVKAVGWLPLTLYDKCQWGPSKKAEREEWLLQLRGKTCFGGVDLSTSRDMTAFVLLFPPQEGLETAVLLPTIWRPRATVEEAERRDHVPYRDWERAGFLRLCEGDIIDYDDVESAIREAVERYDLRMVGFDPYLSRTITQRLTPYVTVIEIPQDLKNMSPAMREIDTMMAKRELLHIHNTCFRWTFGNVRCYVDGNGNIKPLKNRSVGRIDPTVAAIIVMAVWMIYKAQNTYDKKKLREDWSL